MKFYRYLLICSLIISQANNTRLHWWNMACTALNAMTSCCEDAMSRQRWRTSPRSFPLSRHVPPGTFSPSSQSDCSKLSCDCLICIFWYLLCMRAPSWIQKGAVWPVFGTDFLHFFGRNWHGTLWLDENKGQIGVTAWISHAFLQ